MGGWFVWRPTDAAPVLLVAGGSGIVPLMAMLRARRAAGSQVPFRLIYSVRDPAQRYCADELARPELVARCPGCTAVVLRFNRTPTAAWLDLQGAASLHFALPD